MLKNGVLWNRVLGNKSHAQNNNFKFEKSVSFSGYIMWIETKSEK